MERRFHCDAIDPMEYECARCGCAWDDAVLTDYRKVVCSNCYSERVLLVAVRLTFHNWGEQNGGVREQMERYRAAKAAATRAA
jgi:DNA-directed RNA polymerase subunit RPC12/RpoP